MQNSAGVKANKARLEKPEPGACEKCGGPVEPVFFESTWNVYPSHWVTPEVCKRCKNAEQEKEKRLEARELTRQRLSKVNLPGRGEVWTLERALLEARKQKKGEDLNLWEAAFFSVSRWEGFGKGLYLYGQKGLGKTLLCCCLLYDFITKRQKSALFLSVNELIRTVEADFSSYYEARRLVDMAKKMGVLALDEIGEIRVQERHKNALFEIIDHRVSHTLPTIYTSNYNLGELVPRLRDQQKRIIDRIAGSTYGVEFRGKSFRLIQAKREW